MVHICRTVFTIRPIRWDDTGETCAPTRHCARIAEKEEACLREGRRTQPQSKRGNMAQDRSFSKSFTTKLRIYESLGACLKTTPVDKVTVSAVCAGAGVGKSTFYQYFKDKYAVAQWYLDLLYETGAAQIGRTLSWHRGHYITTAGIMQQREVFVTASKSNDYNSIDNYCQRKREQMIIETLTDYQGIEVTRALRSQIIALAAGERAVMSRFIQEYPDISINEMVDYLIGIAPTELYEALKTPQRRNQASASQETPDTSDAITSLLRESILRQNDLS